MSIHDDYRPMRPPHPAQEKSFVSSLLTTPYSPARMELRHTDPDRLAVKVAEVFAQIRGKFPWVYDPEPPIGEELFLARVDLRRRIQGGPLLPDPARIEQQHGPFYTMSTEDNPAERAWVEYLRRVYPNLGRPLTQVEAATLMPAVIEMADKVRPHLEKVAARNPEAYKYWLEGNEEERQRAARTAGLKILGNLLSGDVEGLEDMVHAGNKAYRAYFKALTGTLDPTEALTMRGFDVAKFRLDLAAFRQKASAEREAVAQAKKLRGMLSRPLRFDNVVTGKEETGTTEKWLDHILTHGWWELSTRKKGVINTYWISPVPWAKGPRSNTSYELKKDEYAYAQAMIPRYRWGSDSDPVAFPETASAGEDLTPGERVLPSEAPEDEDPEDADKPQWAKDLGRAAGAILTGRPAEAAPYVREARQKFNEGDYPGTWTTRKVDDLESEIKRLEEYTDIEAYLERRASTQKIGGFDSWYNIYSVLLRAGPTPQLWGKGRVEWVDQVTDDLITPGLLYELCDAVRGDGEDPWPSKAMWEERYPEAEDRVKADVTATEARMDAVFALLGHMAPHLDMERLKGQQGVAAPGQLEGERREAHRILAGLADVAFRGMDDRLTGTLAFRDPSYRASIAREVAEELESKFTLNALRDLPWGCEDQAALIHNGFPMRRAGTAGGLMSWPPEPEQVGVNADQVAGIAKWVAYLKDQVNTVLERAGEPPYFTIPFLTEGRYACNPGRDPHWGGSDSPSWCEPRHPVPRL